MRKSGTATVTLTRGGGFAGDVSLAIRDLPAGITAAALGVAQRSGGARVLQRPPGQNLQIRPRPMSQQRR